MREKIIDRIRKLLALSASEAQINNPEAAGSAAAMAQKLMIQYAVEESQLAPEQRTNEPVETERLNVGTKKIPHWLPRLMGALSRGFFCHSYYAPGIDLIIVGRATDRAACIATFNFIRAEVERLCEVAWKKIPADAEVHGKTWKRSFCEGAVTTISERLYIEKKKLEEAQPGTAIVLANRALAVQDFMKKNIKLRAGHASRIKSHDGYDAGKKAGWTVNLDKRATKQIGN